VDLFGGSVYKTLFDGVLSAANSAGGERGVSSSSARDVAPRATEENATTTQRVYAAGIVSAILCWLHYEGAKEMRSRVHRITRVTSAQADCDYRRRHDYQQYSGEGADAFLDKEKQHRAYMEHPYYRCGDGGTDGPHYLDFSVSGMWSMERTLRNLLLGLTIRTGVRGGHRWVPRILTVLEAGGLFEVLCAMLRMRGFFALRTVLIRIQHSLMAQSEEPPHSAKKKK
jgi:hypothetical protein